MRRYHLNKGSKLVQRSKYIYFYLCKFFNNMIPIRIQIGIGTRLRLLRVDLTQSLSESCAFPVSVVQVPLVVLSMLPFSP